MKPPGEDVLTSTTAKLEPNRLDRRVAIVGAAAAIANGAHHATGIRIRELPLTPDRLPAPSR